MKRVALLAGAGTAGWLALHHRGRTYGSTRHERIHALPGDDYVEDAQIVATHAVTLAAAPDEVWPWLLQVGWHRAGWYTARWVDQLFFPDNSPSAETIVPELQHLEVGDFVPDGALDTLCGFVVVDEVPLEHLVLRSTSHLPLSWRRRGIAGVDWTWSFVLLPTPGGTRLLFRWRAHTRPWWLTLGAHAFLLPADYVMSRSMLRGLARRVASAQPRPHAVAAGGSPTGPSTRMTGTSVPATRPAAPVE
jgi:hypothetical protein